MQASNGYRYAINGMGQRVSKSGPSGTTYFTYDEQGRLIGEYGSGTVRQELVYLADTPVASVRPAASGGIDIYPIYTDHLNTPRLIINAANRTVTGNGRSTRLARRLRTKTRAGSARSRSTCDSPASTMMPRRGCTTTISGTTIRA